MIAGGNIVLTEYAFYLQKMGHKVCLLVVNPTKRRFLANFLHYRPKWIKEKGLKVLRIKDLNKIPQANFLIFSAWAHAWDLRNLPEEKGKKIYFIQHREGLYHGDKDEVEKTYYLPYKKIAVSTWLKEMLKKEFNENSILLLNSFDKNLFNADFLKRKENKIRIMLLNHTYKWKGTKEGVEIVNDLKKKYPSLELILFGAREEKDAYGADEYYYKKIGIDLARVYASCDIFLCPSWDEGFGLPSLEAMACGSALVTYDNGGSRDFAFDNKTAMVAERKNKKELKQKLELLIKDENLRKKIAKQGQEHISTLPTWQEQAKKLEKILLNN